LCIWEKYIIFTFWVWLISLNMVNSCLFFFYMLGLELKALPWTTPPALFCGEPQATGSQFYSSWLIILDCVLMEYFLYPLIYWWVPILI
jgi:hypothetical protein